MAEIESLAAKNFTRKVARSAIFILFVQKRVTNYPDLEPGFNFGTGSGFPIADYKSLWHTSDVELVFSD